MKGAWRVPPHDVPIHEHVPDRRKLLFTPGRYVGATVLGLLSTHMRSGGGPGTDQSERGDEGAHPLSRRVDRCDAGGDCGPCGERVPGAACGQDRSRDGASARFFALPRPPSPPIFLTSMSRRLSALRVSRPRQHSLSITNAAPLRGPVGQSLRGSKSGGARYLAGTAPAPRMVL